MSDGRDRLGRRMQERVAKTGTQPEKAVDPRQKNLGRERFGNIIISSVVQPAYLRIRISLCGQEYERNVTIVDVRLDLGAELHPIFAWHYKVTYDQIHLIDSQNPQAFITIRSGQDVIFPSQCVCHQHTELRIVVNHKDCPCIGLICPVNRFRSLAGSGIPIRNDIAVKHDDIFLPQRKLKDKRDIVRGCVKCQTSGMHLRQIPCERQAYSCAFAVLVKLDKGSKSVPSPPPEYGHHHSTQTR